MDREFIEDQLIQEVFERMQYFEEEYGIKVKRFHAQWDGDFADTYSLVIEEE